MCWSLHQRSSDSKLSGRDPYASDTEHSTPHKHGHQWSTTYTTGGPMVSACRTEVRYHFSLRVHPFTARSFQHKFVPSRAEHSHRSVTYCSPASETADHTGGSRDHGWPHNHSIGLKGCDHTWTTGHPADGRTSHGGTHVRFKQSRITQARSGAQRVASQTQPLPTCGHVHIHHCAALFNWGSHPCLTSEYLLGQPLESISSRPAAQDTVTGPLEVTRFS